MANNKNGSLIGKAKDIGNKLKAGRGGKGDQGYDVMNPEAVNPNAKRAMNQLGKALKKLAKLIGKLIKKLVELLLKLGWVGIIILLILLLLIIIVAFQHMPGMMKDKLLSLFSFDIIGDWFENGATSALSDDYEDIIGVANYLEEMGYSLVGDGFVTPVLRRGDGSVDDTIYTIDELTEMHEDWEYKADSEGGAHFYLAGTDTLVPTDQLTSYYDSVGRKVDNQTGKITSEDEYTDKFGIIRTLTPDEDDDTDVSGATDNTKGKVVKIEEKNLKSYKLIRSYLLSNYRIYTLKNQDEDLFNQIGDALRRFTGGDGDAWAKGLLKLYNSKNGKATQAWWWGEKILGDAVSINDTTLTLKKGWFNNPMTFTIEGWAPRYGMSLEFLISLHLGTGAPDLTNAMLQNFDTEVQVYLNDSGKAHVDASYVDPQNIVTPGNGDTIDKIEDAMDATGHDFAAWLVNDQAALEWVNGMALTKKVCQDLLTYDGLTLSSPPNCIGSGQASKIVGSTYETSSILGFDTTGNNFNTYGITAEVDPDVYGEFDEYSNYVFKGEDKSKIDFDIVHVSQGIGTDNSDVLADDYTFIPGTAQRNGFDLSKRTAPKTDYNKLDDGKYAFEILRQTTYTNAIKKSGTLYKVRKVKNYNTWESDKIDDGSTVIGDGEEVEYEWVAYKYLIYEVGTWTQEASDYKEGSAHGYKYYTDIKWDNPATKTYSGTDKWVETIIVEFVVRDKTIQELIDSELLTVDEEGNYHWQADGGRCDTNDQEKCCGNCQKYVKAVIKALASVSDQDYRSYTPYIARVVGSWFRDTYFVIPDSPDEAILSYASSGMVSRPTKDDKGNNYYLKVIPRPEFNIKNTYGSDTKYVKVDEEYLGDTGEYWSSYVMKDDDPTKYQLYVLKSDGTTSDTTMEYFLDHCEIDGEPATIFGKACGPYKTEADGNQYEAAKERAEKDGWAFVKKAVMEDFKSNVTSDNLASTAGILWSAYNFDSDSSTTSWTRATRDDDNEYVTKLYDIIYGKDEDGESSSGIFYQLTVTNNVTQEEDAQRGPTNTLVKYLFKYRKYYIYDGGEERALAIQHDKIRVLKGYKYYVEQDYDFQDMYYNNKVLAEEFEDDDVEFILGCDEKDKGCDNFYHYKGLLAGDDENGGVLHDIYGDNWKAEVVAKLNNYGRSALRQAYSLDTLTGLTATEDLAEQWLDWQLDMFYMRKFGVDLSEYYGLSGTSAVNNLLKLEYDPRDPDLISTVEITKSSLSVFSILENTGTLDADYAYRDFKELIVELDYFDKEELSEKIPTIFTWVLPDTSPAGWPVRQYDKADVDYGTLIHSKETYDALDAYVSGLPASTSDGSGGTGTPDDTGGTGTPDDTGGTGTPDDTTSTPATSSKIDEAKIFWLGDSWINGLSGVAKSPAEYIDGRVGKNADVFRSNPATIPDDVSAIVIEFGLNNPALYTETQGLIDTLLEQHPNVPIFVLKTSHVAKGYTYGSTTADDLNRNLNKYNDEMSKYCSSKDKVTFLDVTKNINQTNGTGYLKDEYANSDHLHLNDEGKKVWYADIISAINTADANSGGTLATFEGYEADQYVSSPVTGKVMEVGKHQRMNLYTQQMEEVEYIIIQVMDAKYFTDDMCSGVEFESTVDEDDEHYEDYDTAAEALNFFYDEYENVCAGYTVMIDGFDVDLSLDEEQEAYGTYVKNEVHGLANTEEKTRRENIEKAKLDAPFYISYGMSKDYPEAEDNYVANENELQGYYVKEGKYIGKTITGTEALVANPTDPAEPEPEPAPEPTPDGGDPTDTTGTGSLDKLTYTYYDYEGPADYMRIIIKDNVDYAIVDDVESFFDIPESGGLSLRNVSQEYQAQPRDLEVLAEVIRHESGGWEAYLTKYNVNGDDEALFNGYCMGFSVVNKCLEQNKPYYGHLYDASRSDMSILVQITTNQRAIWYGGTVPEEAMKVYQGGEGCYSAKDLELAEYCLTNDSTSVIKPYETKIGTDAADDGYTATAQGTPIPRAMCQQGGYGDGASGQSGIILVGFEDGCPSDYPNDNGYFDKGDELFGVDRTMEKLIE